MASVALLATLCSLLHTAAGSIFSSQDEKSLEAVMQALMECHGIPGLSLAVVKGNQSWTRGFGLADVEHGVNVTSSTLFLLGSVGKTFNAMLLAMLLQDSKNVTWTSKVTSVLGEGFRFVDDVRTEHANLVDVVAHRMGLQSQYLTFFTAYPAHVSRQTVVSRLRYLGSSGEFRGGYNYNNWMYVLAGRIAEVLAGDKETWESLLHKRLLTPLAMTSTGVVGRDLELSHPSMANAYKMVEGRMTKVDDDVYSCPPFAPAGMLVSSAEDMVTWLKFVLDRGRTTSGQQLLTEESMQAMTSVHNTLGQEAFGFWRPAFPVSDVVLGYGLGWYISLYRGRLKWEHGGVVHGYQSNVCVFPEVKAAIFMAFNGMASPSEFTRDVICYVIADLLMGEEAWLNTSTACHFRITPPTPSQPQEKTTASTSCSVADFRSLQTSRRPAGKTTASTSCSVAKLDPEPYVGTYGSKLLGDVEVRLNSSLSALVLTCNRLVAVLRPSTSANEFEGHVRGELRFWNYQGSSEFRRLPVRFLSLAHGKYGQVELVKEFVFCRGVRFQD